jgi:hypothetical protein
MQQGYRKQPAKAKLENQVLTKVRFDASKFILEHYIDGDLLDERTPTSRNKAAPGNLHVWGKSLSEWSTYDVSANQ